jgi:hypothetical protein
MGVKLFAWLGGFAAFLGVAYLVKYSFEHDLIPPEVRVALGFLLSIGLVVGGLFVPRARYAVTSQTLCAAGIVSLYAVTFACRAVYHFAFFGLVPTFGLMALITATAFLLAVRLEARVVAVLGLLGGFLTPLLLSTGQDNPLGLFTYIALLDVGLLAVALHRRWHFLVPLGAAGTALMQFGWAGKFLGRDNTLVPIVVCLAFDALFLAGAAVARRLRQSSTQFSFSVAALVAVSFIFGAYLALKTPVGLQPGRLLTFLFLADAALLAIAWLDARAARLHALGGVALFAILLLWTQQRLTPGLLPAALAAYFIFAVLHAAFPLVLERVSGDAAGTRSGQMFPLLALVLVLSVALSSPTVSFLVWPAILLIDLVAIALAWFTASLLGVAAVLMLTLAVAAACVFKIPADLTGISPLLLVIGAFAFLFAGAGLWLTRKFAANGSASNETSSRNPLHTQLPAMSVLLPFALLVMLVSRLPLLDPSPVFGLALLLAVLSLGLARLLLLEWLPAWTLAGVLAVTFTWAGRQLAHFDPDTPLAWYVGFIALFAVFPFLFRRTFLDTRGPWITAAAAPVLFFQLVFATVKRGWPNDAMGLLAAAFALPALASLVAVLRLDPPEHPRRLGRLALFGGTALLFITLIFPIQFDRQWITLGWALEGTALLWLFHRVPHRGLAIAGTGLLVGAFVRLALNPAVYAYQPRGDTPILNWYLYAYGVAALCLFAGARLLAPPRERAPGFPTPPLLNALGLVLLFLLLNIEIADYFTPPGRHALVFEFSGNFARDMTYTIAWALFAFGLLVLGIWKSSRGARYTALGLLGATVLKLFFHDLAHLSQLYRIGALFAVAVIAMLASFAYQRFLPAEKPADDRAP